MRPRKSPLRATLNEGVTFTTETLRELLQKKVLNSRLRIPSDEALAELARILEVWRPYYLADQSLRPLQREAHAAAQRLSQPLKKMRQLNEEFYTTAMRDAAPAFVLDILKKRLAAIDGAFDSFASLNREQITVEYGDRYKLTWTWLADALPIDFERAMLSIESELQGGYRPFRSFDAVHRCNCADFNRRTADFGQRRHAPEKAKKFLGGKIAPDEFSPKT